MGKRSKGKPQKVQRRRKPDVIDVTAAPPPAPKPPSVRETPTAEQFARTPYVVGDTYAVSSSGRRQTIGKAYQRQPRFETIEGLSLRQLTALRRYRRAFDTSELSTVKSGLDIGVGGSTGGAWAVLARLEKIAFADIALQALEAMLPVGLLRTMRSVALLDADFSAVAIERFGGRVLDRIETSSKKAVTTTSLAPRSGKHRALIRDEFMRGATALADHLFRAPTVEQAPLDKAGERLAPAAVPTAYLDERGRMLPLDEVAEIIRLAFIDPGSEAA